MHRDQRGARRRASPSAAAQRARAGRVVRAVEDRERARADHLEPPGRAHRLAPPRAPRAGSSGAVERLGGRHRDGEVLALERARAAHASRARRSRSRRSRVAQHAAAARRAPRPTRSRDRQRLGAERAGDQRAAGRARRRASPRRCGARSGPSQRVCSRLDVGQHLHVGARSRWWRRSARRGRPRPPPPRLPPAPAPSRRPPSAPRTGSRGRPARACGRPAPPPRRRARPPPRSARRRPALPPTSTRSANETRCGDR